MASPSISQIRTNQTDFQKTYMWQLSFLRLPDASVLTIEDSDDPSYWFNMLCVSTTTPKRTGQTSTFFLHGNQVFDPGIYNVEGTINLTFVEQVSAPVRTFISQWTSACTAKSQSFIGLSADLRLVTMDNQKNQNWEYQMLWCFIETSDTNQLDAGSSSDPMQPTITIRYTEYGDGPAGSVTFPDDTGAGSGGTGAIV